MIVKKENKFKKIFPYIILAIVVAFIYIFRVKSVNFILNIKEMYFMDKESQILTLGEKEELNALRSENNVLRDENKKVREEFQVGEIDEVKSAVYLLLSQSSLYGDFYVTLPSNKTVYKGMNIFSTGNVVVGTVTEVLPNSLRVERLGQNKTFIASSLEEDESIEFKSLSAGLYAGNAAGGSKVSVGDTIVLKGFPKAIVGTVVEVSKSDTSLSVVFVRTPYNIQNKEMFYVLQ